MKDNLNRFFELTLYAKKDFSPYFLALKDYAKQNFCGKYILTSGEKNSFGNDQNTCSFLLAVSIDDKDKLLMQLKQQIIKYILVNKKSFFLSQNIRSLGSLGNIKDIFLKILTMFDEEQDILEIEKNLRFSSEFYLNEFYLFKLKNLQKKWLEICTMTNENSFFFDADGLVFELLRYLISNIKPKDDFLRLDFANDLVLIKDKTNTTIFTQNLAEFENDAGKNVALKILDFMPKRIYLGNNFPDSKSTENLLSIFKNSLKVVDYAWQKFFIC